MKKWIIRICIGLGTLIGLLFIGVNLISEQLPQGQTGPAAEALADKMLASLNLEAYEQLDTLSWTFPRGHHFIWDKKANIVNVIWEEYEVTFSPETMEGKATKDAQLLSGTEKEEAIREAWEYFANDSFWLVAPYKVRDPGTTRTLVNTEEGDALLVTYSSGGVTPGDSYLWMLDDNGRPIAWKMWVNIIPIGGLRFSWDNWKSYEGAWFATDHKGLISLNLSNISVK